MNDLNRILHQLNLAKNTSESNIRRPTRRHWIDHYVGSGCVYVYSLWPYECVFEVVRTCYRRDKHSQDRFVSFVKFRLLQVKKQQQHRVAELTQSFFCLELDPAEGWSFVSCSICWLLRQRTVWKIEEKSLNGIEMASRVREGCTEFLKYLVFLWNRQSDALAHLLRNSTSFNQWYSGLGTCVCILCMFSFVWDCFTHL